MHDDPEADRVAFRPLATLRALATLLARRGLLLAVPLALAGCLTSDPARFMIEPVPAATQIQTSADTIAIANVSLPSYAKETGMIVQDATGALVPVPNADWADEPERAMTFALVRNLADISGAKVAADPWPLGGVPEAEVRVRVERMLVDNTGTMRLTGQYTIRRDELTSRNRVEGFDIQVPSSTSSPTAIVRAHGAAWRDLAELIAKAI